MEAQRPQHTRRHTHKGISTVLVCWLVAVGLMILVSANGHGDVAPSRQAMQDVMQMH